MQRILFAVAALAVLAMPAQACKGRWFPRLANLFHGGGSGGCGGTQGVAQGTPVAMPSPTPVTYTAVYNPPPVAEGDGYTPIRLSSPLPTTAPTCPGGNCPQQQPPVVRWFHR